MPITAEKIEEAFGYPLLTNAQHEFMTVRVRHHLLTPWYHATKTDETKKQMWDVIHSFRNRVFWHGCLFYFTLEHVQSAIKEGVYIEPVLARHVTEDLPKAYGQEALMILVERVKEELASKYLYDCPSKRMTLEDTTTLLKLLHVAHRSDVWLCEAFGFPWKDKGWGDIPGIVYNQVEFLQTLESEKA